MTGKQMGFYIDQTRCIGCYTCAVACKDWYNIDAGPVNWMRIKEIEHGNFPNPFLAYLPSPCYHCADPACIKACPEGAITKRESDGIVIVNQDKCIGNSKCDMYCLKACPWDSPQFGPEEGAKMQKCNLCIERLDNGQQPICVEACPMFALEVGPINELREKYGNITEAEGFQYSERFKPSVIFKPRKK
ncbi:MAG: 4Fe-4S dicluster domain-containing protein [Promethearchaeota archaeon]